MKPIPLFSIQACGSQNTAIKLLRKSSHLDGARASGLGKTTSLGRNHAGAFSTWPRQQPAGTERARSARYASRLAGLAMRSRGAVWRVTLAHACNNDRIAATRNSTTEQRVPACRDCRCFSETLATSALLSAEGHQAAHLADRPGMVAS